MAILLTPKILSIHNINTDSVMSNRESSGSDETRRAIVVELNLVSIQAVPLKRCTALLLIIGKLCVVGQP